MTCFPEGLKGFSYHLIPIINSTNPDKLKNERAFLKEFINVFCVDRRKLKMNMYILSTETNGGLSIDKIEKLPYYDYEEYISIHNETKKKAKDSEDESNNKTNLPDQSKYINKISSMANKFKK